MPEGECPSISSSMLPMMCRYVVSARSVREHWLEAETVPDILSNSS